VCRLSIIVPFLDDTEQFEGTLASVLQNRPEDCEILVVHRGLYADPYDLKDEVGFVETPAGAQLVETINAGLCAASGEVVHVLRAGVLAHEGWTEPALEQFDDPLVGAVSPVVLQADDLNRIVSAGIRYTAGGRRLLNGAGKHVKRTRRVVRRRTVGPTLAAAFYRRDVIEALGGLSAMAGNRFADVDVALCLKALGYCSVVEPASIVVGDETDHAAAGGLRSGRLAERVFWCHAGTNGWLRSLCCHPFAIAGELLVGCRRPEAYTSLLGRILGMIQAFFCGKKDRARIGKAEELLEDGSWSSLTMESWDEDADNPDTSAERFERDERRRAA